MKLKTKLAAIFLWFSVAAFPATAEKLPDQPTIAVETASGEMVLKNWSPAPATSDNMKKRFVPDAREFSGADTWIVAIEDADLKRASRKAFSAAGMNGVKILAFEAANPAALDVIDSQPAAQAASVMVEGKIDGRLARGIAFVLFASIEGDVPETASVHGFMAPRPVFEALGGMAIPGVLHFGATTAPDENMLEDGTLKPVQAVQKLNSFFAGWVEGYVIPMMSMSMQMQLQSIENMQSWNNAMNACAGDTSCNVVPMNDGSGGWTTER